MITALAMILALCIPATGTAVSDAAAGAGMLALDAHAFPSGAIVTDTRVDTTVVAVDGEGMLGNPDTHGQLYGRLHFAGSLFEDARLPRFGGAGRQVWLMATLFPAAGAAQRAFAADAQLGVCTATPAIALPLRRTTCTYVNTKGKESGAYVVAVAGNVEFIVLGFVSKASAAAGEKALRDAAYVALREANHVGHLLAMGALRVVPSPVLRTVRVGAAPATIMVDRQAGRVLVLNGDAHSVSILDAHDGTMIRTAPTTLDGFEAAALDARTGRLFISDGSSKVVLLDTHTGAIMRTVEPNPDGTISVQSAGADEATGHVFMIDTFGTVYTLDARTGATLRTTTVGAFPDAVAVDSGTARAFVANRDGGSVSVLDTRTGRVVRTVRVGKSPMFIAADTTGGRVFTVNANPLGNENDDTVGILDARTGAVVRIVRVPDAFRLAVDERAGYVFVINNGNDTQQGSLSMLDARSGAVRRIIPLGLDPTALAIDARRGRAFIANAGDNTVSVVNTDNGTVLGTYAVGKRPADVAVDEGTGRAFVANGDGNSVSILNTAVGP